MKKDIDIIVKFVDGKKIYYQRLAEYLAQKYSINRKKKDSRI